LRIFNRHIKNVGYTLAFKANFQRFAVIACALARLACDINIGQKMHLDLDDAIALTRFAAPAFDVKAEPPRLIPSRL